MKWFDDSSLWLKNNKALVIVFFLVGWLYFFNLGKIPFIDRTDSRYSEISREMVCSNDYLNPKIYGTLHLHKPPIAYWITALGLKIFGFNEFGARFFLAFFALISFFLIYLISKEFVEKEVAITATILSSIAPGIFFTSRIVATDIFLLTFQLLSMLFFIKYYKFCKNKYLTLFWVMLSLAFLTKGPAGVIPLFLIIFFFYFMNKELKLFKKMFNIKFMFIFFILSFSWFIYIFSTIPGSFYYLIVDQLFARFGIVDNVKMGHPQPFYFYIVVFNFLIFPFFIYIYFSLFSFKRNLIKEKLLLPFLWFSIPLVFFSFISTKLSSYVIFTIPPASLLIAFWFHKTKFSKIFLLAVIGFIPLLFLGKVSLLNGLPDIYQEITLLKILSILFIIGTIYIIYKHTKLFPLFLLFSWVVVYSIILNMFAKYPEIIGANNKICKIVSEKYPEETEIICYKEFGYQIPFYLNKIPILCGVETELKYQRFKNTCTLQELEEKWNSEKRIIVLCSQKHLNDLKIKLNKMQLIATQGKLFAFTNH